MRLVPAAIRPPSLWLRQVSLVVRKDVVIELRSGEVVAGSAFFALLIVVLASIALSGGGAVSRVMASGVIWIALAFAAVLGIARAWQRERQDDVLSAWVVSPLQPSALFFGKCLGLGAFLVVVQGVIVPLTLLLFSLDAAAHLALLSLVSLLAIPGIAAAGTLFGVMTVRTRARDLLLAIVLFPLLAPSLVTAVAATRELLGGAPLAELRGYLVLLAAFDLTLIGLGASLFGILIED